MGYRSSVRYFVIAAVLAAASAVVLAGSPALAASNAYSSIATSGPSSQTVRLSGSIVTVTFGSPTRVATVTPDGYVEQHVSVSDIGTGINTGFESTISGDWQYNGTYAYLYGAAPKCVSTLAIVLDCYNLNNGVKMPAPMEWIDEGWAVNAGLPYEISIYLYGSGTHKVSISGP
jgi:hypothetical protein